MTDLYQHLIRPVAFSTDPEWATGQTLRTLAWLAGWAAAPLRYSFCRSDPRLEQTLWGIRFPNPVGLAAGFDKDGLAAAAWPLLGFGFAELGTVTAQAQAGNPRPRLFRLAADRAALNRMGFNNHGSERLAAHLGQLWQQQPRSIPIGINLGKSKQTPLEEAPQDYLTSFRRLRDLGDYLVVNVSSPNTPGLRSLQAAEQLRAILDPLQAENQGIKPLLVKIAPDLEWDELWAILEVAHSVGVAGIVATNTTTRRDGLQTRILAATGCDIATEAGGISGAPLRQRSTEVIRWLRAHTTLPIVGVGGIFTAEDAWEKILAGANLVQVYTGWIYEGPGMVGRILAGLGQKLAEQRLNSLADVFQNT